MERTILIRIENTQIKVIRRTLNIPNEMVQEDEIMEYITDNYLAEDDEEYEVGDIVKQEIVEQENYSSVEDITLVE